MATVRDASSHSTARAQSLIQPSYVLGGWPCFPYPSPSSVEVRFVVGDRLPSLHNSDGGTVEKAREAFRSRVSEGQGSDRSIGRLLPRTAAQTLSMRVPNPSPRAAEGRLTDADRFAFHSRQQGKRGQSSSHGSSPSERAFPVTQP